MKKILKVLLIMFLTLVLLVISLLAYVLIKNPLGLGDVIKSSISLNKSKIKIEDYKDYNNPLLSEDQEKSLIEAGVDIRKLPTKISKAQKQCGLEKLGQKRILEIEKGAKPTALEIIKLSACLQK